MKKLSFYLLLFLLLYCFNELLSLGVLHYLKISRHITYEPADSITSEQKDIITKLIKKKTSFTIYDPVLGWTIKPNGRSKLYQANSEGIRGNKEYNLNPAPGIVRISTFGDSFTLCAEVNNDQTWQNVMESQNQGVEVINFGVGGYGLDQAFLRYLKIGRKFNSDVVLICFMPENIYRNLNVFRPFYYPNTKSPLSKPRFLIKDGELILSENPMKRLEDYRDILATPRQVLHRIGKK